MAKGWHRESYRHALAAKGVKTKMMTSKLLDWDIYKKVNILSGGVDGNHAIGAAITENPKLWDVKTPVRMDAQTIVALKDSSTGDMYPGLKPGNIVGYIRYKPVNSRNGDVLGYELTYLEVRKDWQRKGVGYAMLGKFFDDVIEYDKTVFIAYGSEEGKIFWDKFYNDPTIRNELWERDVTITIED